MVKRKQTSNSELRSSQLPLTVHKFNLTALEPSAKQHWNIDNIQPYFPPIEKLFKTSDLENVLEYGIKFNEEAVAVLEPTKIRTSVGTRDIHNKVTMLLSPYKWMRGAYGSLGLPTSSEQASAVFEKLQNPNNAGYVGAIVSAVLSQSGCAHFPAVYGLFVGTSSSHTIDISDDYGDLSDRAWFSQNIGKTFDIKLSDDIQESTEFKHTRTSRLAVRLGDDTDLGVVEELNAIPADDAVIGSLTRVLQDDAESDDESDSSSVSTSYIFGVRSCNCSEDESEDGEDYESFAWATFKNVPVQVTVMEKCTGTLYELMMLHPETEKHHAWISQVIFGLAFAQRLCGFTHNDLHANNVMYVKTDEEYFYYNSGGVLYRLPTFGYLIKIIDFERGVVSVKITGMKEPKLFMSDHYDVDEEAGGQYNYGDYYRSKYPEMKPNPSFDLVRLATSIFWDLFPEGPSCAEYSENLLFKMFMKWLTLEDGKSIMFSKLAEEHDRYHGFHLYKAIARFCKDAIPRKEIQSLKDIYGVESVPEGSSVLLIDHV